ncbi:MAG: DUF3843 family protein [Tannerella sp.]|jgi:hypothetical protein|nr:DUF3843 family protein [Tannerella sp.]
MSIIFKKKKRARNDLVVMRDWAKLHPVSSPTDPYYLQLCNKTLKIILNSELKDDFDTAEDMIRQACILVAYFEDVISETGLFRAFNERYKALYGNGYLPFYDTATDYYPGEINLYDVQFLVWHSLSIQCWEDDGLLFNPFFQDSILTAINAVYDLFDREFEHAPQNGEMQEFMRLPPHPDVNEIRNRLDFLVSQSYLNIIEYTVFTDKMYKRLEKEAFDDSQDLMKCLKKQEAQRYDEHVDRMFNHCSALLAQRASEELAALAGETHPQYQLLKRFSERKIGCFLFRKENAEEMVFEHIPSKTQVKVSKEYLTIQSGELTPDRSIMAMGIVKWGNTWQQMGAAAVFDNENDFNKNNDWPGAEAFDNEEAKNDALKQMYGFFLQASGGKQAVFIKNMEDWHDFYARFLDAHSGEADGMQTQKKTALMEEASNFMKERNLPMTVFFNLKGGLEFYPGVDVTPATPGNDSPEAEKNAPLEVFIVQRHCAKEFVDYLRDNRLTGAPPPGKSWMDASVILANYDFLLRYYKQNDYWTQPHISLVETN